MLRTTDGVEPGARTARASPFMWWLCVVLLLSTVLNYLNRQVFSLTAEKVMAEYGIGNEGYGQLVAAFRYSYAGVQIFGGWIVDVAGPRLVFPIAVGVWSVATLLTMQARSFGELASSRFMLGVGEALNWPCALKTTERLLKPADRPLANGIFNSGTALGGICAPIIVTLLVVRDEWRTPFAVVGALGAIWIVLWLVATRRHGNQLGGGSTSVREVPGLMLGFARRPDFWRLVTAAVLINGVSYVLADWVPLYLKTDGGFSFVAGTALSMLVFIGLDAGNLLSGYLVRRAINRGTPPGRARTVALAVSCMGMSCAVSVGWASSRYVALAALIVAAMGVAGFLVIYLTAVQDLDSAHVGITSGMLGGLGNLIYGLISPYIGRLWDLGGTHLMFVLAGTLPWLAYLFVAQIVRRQS